MKRKIALYGAYGEANIGDDLLLDTLLEWLMQESPNSDVYISSDNKDYLKVLYGNCHIVPKIRMKYMNPDLFISGGGTQLFSFDNGKTKSTNKFKNRIRLILKNPLLVIETIFYKLIKRNTNFNKIAIEIGLGPFEVHNSEVLVKNTLSGFNMVMCRDSYSHALCVKYDIPSKLVADICFSDYFKNKYKYMHKRTGNKPYVGIVLRDWSHNSNGEILNSKMIEWINNNYNNYNINIFLFSFIKDNVLFKRLEGVVKSKIHVWNPRENNYHDYLNEFSKMDVLITSRFHAGVFGANFNIPTICLGIDPKLFYLKQEVEGFNYFEPYQDIEVLNDYLDNIFKNYSQIQKEITESTEKLNKRANINFLISKKYL